MIGAMMLLRARTHALRQCPAVVLAILSCAIWGSPASALDPETAHWASWQQCLDSARANPAARFGFYAYRTLATPHPEVYLQADALFSEAIEDLPGSRLAYRTRDVLDLDFYQRLARRENKGGAFSWSMWTVQQDSVYDDESTRKQAWWSRRLAPAGVLLRVDTPHLSTLEAASMRYTAMRRARHDRGSLFVVCDKQGTGFLAADSVLWAGGLSERPVDNWSKVRPVLIFNEHSVWYPLMGRDDRATDSALSRLVARLGNPGEIELPKDAFARISQIREQLALRDDASQRLAVLVASGLTDRGQPVVDHAWAAYDTSQGVPNAPCTGLLLRESIYWGNHLSPHTALLAATLADGPADSAYPRSQAFYLERAGRKLDLDDTAETRLQAYGVLWSYGLMETVIDDNIRARAGLSFSQAAAMSAALDMAGREHWQVGLSASGKAVPDQEWLISIDGRWQYNLGVWTWVPPDLPHTKAVLNLTGIALHGHTMQFGGDASCSSLDDLEASQALSRIDRAMGSANLNVLLPKGNLEPLSRFAAQLAEETRHTQALAWPQAATRGE